jgi:hypothetical protein
MTCAANTTRLIQSLKRYQFFDKEVLVLSLRCKCITVMISANAANKTTQVSMGQFKSGSPVSQGGAPCANKAAILTGKNKEVKMTRFFISANLFGDYNFINVLLPVTVLSLVFNTCTK